MQEFFLIKFDGPRKYKSVVSFVLHFLFAVVCCARRLLLVGRSDRPGWPGPPPAEVHSHHQPRPLSSLPKTHQCSAPPAERLPQKTSALWNVFCCCVGEWWAFLLLESCRRRLGLEIVGTGDIWKLHYSLWYDIYQFTRVTVELNVFACWQFWLLLQKQWHSG